MFAKLLKHEWKSSYKLIGLLSLVIVILGAIGAVALRFIAILSDISFENPDMSVLAAFGMLTLMMLLMFVIFSLILYASAVQIFLLYRFYKNKFTDEGYLTFTLPVKARDIFLSSGLNMVIWYTISLLIVFGVMISIVIFGLFDKSWLSAETFDIIRIFKELFLSGFDATFSLIYFAIYLLMLPISLVFSTVMGMTSITLGAVAVKKYKVLAAIGVYYGINTVIQMLASILSILPVFIVILLPSEIAVYVYQIATIAMQLGLYVALSIGGYFLSVRLMERKLNLP